MRFRALILDVAVLSALFLGLFFSVYSPTREQLLVLDNLLISSGLSFLLGLAFCLAFRFFRVVTLGDTVFLKPDQVGKQPPLLKSFWGWQLIILLVTSLYGGLRITHFSIDELFSEAGFAGAIRIFTALATPTAEILPLAILGIVETIFIAFVSTAFAVPVAFILAFFAAKNIMGKSPLGFAIYGLLRTAFNISRSIEPLIWAIIFSVWVGIGPFAGMLALMLHSIASLTKQYSEMMEVVEDGPVEGIQSTGAHPIQVIWYGIVPQVVLPYVSFTIYRWDINIRMATIIGLVGGGGIGTMLIQYQGQALWHEVGTIVFVIAAVVWIMDTASAYIREALK